jgi:hypothetical protein
VFDFNPTANTPTKPISQYRKVFRSDAHGGKDGDDLGGFGQCGEAQKLRPVSM